MGVTKLLGEDGRKVSLGMDAKRRMNVTSVALCREAA